ncbi:unnamed protein product, partial [Ectocarpus sp. 12 AP-2014]
LIWGRWGSRGRNWADWRTGVGRNRLGSWFRRTRAPSMCLTATCHGRWQFKWPPGNPDMSSNRHGLGLFAKEDMAAGDATRMACFRVLRCV